MNGKPLHLTAALGLLCVLCASSWGAQGKAIKIPNWPRLEAVRAPVGMLARRGPDLVAVAPTGPDRALAGTAVGLTFGVQNAGRAAADGTQDGPAGGYMVDVVLSTDSTIPFDPAVQPATVGGTRNDFVEDMLIEGGRFSVTPTLAPGAGKNWTFNAYIPRNTAPGVYTLAIVADPYHQIAETTTGNNIAVLRITIGAPDLPEVTAPGVWVMPYAVGNTRLDQIQSDGKTDYRDGGSGIMMEDAPFGGNLGFRLGYENSIPKPEVAYYRWLYQAPGSSDWQEFTATVAVHYQKDTGGTITFPVYLLGPKSVAGKHLYEFRPHAVPTELGPGVSWPASDWFGDIYSAFLNTVALADGTYRIKVEIYDSAGAQVAPGTAFRFIVPTGATPAGEVSTRDALTSELDAGGGFMFNLCVNNRVCGAAIDAPHIGDTAVADPCGFLRYTDRSSDKITLSFSATHPQQFAVFGFFLVRATTTVHSVSADITATAVAPYSGSGSGEFSHDFVINELIRPECPGWAAFSENLHVYAKATTGWGLRIGAYDASSVRAFAIAPPAGAPVLIPKPAADAAGEDKPKPTLRAPIRVRPGQ